jgi:hypothetical protein
MTINVHPTPIIEYLKIPIPTEISLVANLDIIKIKDQNKFDSIRFPKLILSNTKLLDNNIFKNEIDNRIYLNDDEIEKIIKVENLNFFEKLKAYIKQKLD